MATTIPTVITYSGDIPDRNQQPAVWNVNMNSLISYYTTFQSSYNASVAAMNTSIGEAEGFATSASESAVAAANSADDASDILTQVQQIQATLDQDVQINDTTASTTSVYSSSKTEQVALDLIDDTSTAIDKTWSAQKLFDEVGQGSVVRATASGAISETDLVSLISDGRLELTQAGGVSDISIDSIATDTNSCKCDRLTDTSYVVVFDNQDSTDRGQFAIVDASGSTPVIGTPEIFSAGTTNVQPDCVVSISPTKFAVFSRNTDSVFVVDISGTTSVTETALTASAFQFRAKLVDTDKIAVVSSSGGNSYVSIVDINIDDTATQSTPVLVSNSDDDYTELAIIDSSKFIVVYTALSTAGSIRARICDVSGSSITVNTENTLVSTATSRVYSCDIVNGFLCSMYWTNNPSNSTRLNVSSISGNTITTVDTEVVRVETGLVSYMRVNATQNKTASIAYIDSDTAGRIRPLKIDDDGGASLGSETIYTVINNASVDQCHLSENKVAVFYRDQGGDQSGDTFTAQVNRGNTQDWIGFSRENTADGDENSANVSGVISGLSGLQINKTYYVDSATATLTLADTGIKVGRAIAADKLLITGTGAY